MNLEGSSKKLSIRVTSQTAAMPRLIIAGMHKAGTTSLHEALTGHVAVVRHKEPHFLVQDALAQLPNGAAARVHPGGVMASADSYFGLGATGTAWVDASVWYSAFPQDFVSSYKSHWGAAGPPVLVIVRSRFARLASAYNYARRSNPFETAPTLEQAVLAELSGQRDGLHPSARHVSSSCVGPAIQTMVDAGVPVKLMRFEQLLDAPGPTIESIAGWANIHAVGDLPKANPGTGSWRSDRLRRWSQSRVGSTVIQGLKKTPAAGKARALALSKLLGGEPDKQLSPNVTTELHRLFDEDEAKIRAILGTNPSVGEFCGGPLHV